MGILLAVLGVWLGLYLVELLFCNVDRPRVVGHRGAGGMAPGNTLTAVDAGIQSGADAVEVDIHRTRDGVLVVMHDATVDRTTDGSGAIADLTWEEMQQLDAGTGFSPEYAGTRVPSLRQVIDRVRDAECDLVIEVKEPELYPGIEEDVADLLDEVGEAFAERVVIISFDVEWLRRFHEVAPHLRLGQLHLWGGRWPRYAGTAYVDVYWRSALLDPTLVLRARLRGYQVWVWTADQPWAARLLWALGVQAVTTDRPDRIVPLAPKRD